MYLVDSRVCDHHILTIRIYMYAAWLRPSVGEDQIKNGHFFPSTMLIKQTLHKTPHFHPAIHPSTHICIHKYEYFSEYGGV